MGENLYDIIDNFMKSWQDKLSKEMSLFWGKSALNDVLQNMFNTYLLIVKTNMEELKKGTLTAEQVKKYIEELKRMLENSFKELTNNIIPLKNEKISKIIDEKIN